MIHNATEQHSLFFLFLLINEHYHKNIIRIILKVHLTINTVFLVVVLIIFPFAMDSIFDKVFALQTASSPPSTTITITNRTGNH